MADSLGDIITRNAELRSEIRHKRRQERVGRDSEFDGADPSASRSRKCALGN